MDSLRANYAVQSALGLASVRLTSASEVAGMMPQLRSDDILGGSFCSTDGFVDPHSVMTGFMLRAIDLGARLMRNAEVTAIERDASGVCGVRTASGHIATRTVVNAAGAWAGLVAKLAGVDLPV